MKRSIARSTPEHQMKSTNGVKYPKLRSGLGQRRRLNNSVNLRLSIYAINRLSSSAKVGHDPKNASEPSKGPHKKSFTTTTSAQKTTPGTRTDRSKPRTKRAVRDHMLTSLQMITSILRWMSIRPTRAIDRAQSDLISTCSHPIILLESRSRHCQTQRITVSGQFRPKTTK